MSHINGLRGYQRQLCFYKHFVPTGLLFWNPLTDSSFINNTHTVKRKSSASKIERAQRVVISEKEALKRMKEFSKRKEQFLDTARTGKAPIIRP